MVQKVVLYLKKNLRTLVRAFGHFRLTMIVIIIMANRSQWKMITPVATEHNLEGAQPSSLIYEYIDDNGHSYIKNHMFNIECSLNF